jgi:hypothetical protein
MAGRRHHDGRHNDLARLDAGPSARSVCILLDLVTSDNDRNHVRSSPTARDNALILEKRDDRASDVARVDV